MISAAEGNFGSTIDDKKLLKRRIDFFMGGLFFGVDDGR